MNELFIRLDAWWYDMQILLSEFGDEIYCTRLPMTAADTWRLADELSIYGIDTTPLIEAFTVLENHSQYLRCRGKLGEPIRRERFREAGDRAAIVVQRIQAEILDFKPTDMQTLILNVLDGRALTQVDLMAELRIGSKETLNGKDGIGGMRELRERNLVLNDRRRGGFYRPDKPPD